VRVHGANGAGKTTLLRALLAAARLPPERVLFLPQELTADDVRVLQDAVYGLPPAQRGHTLTLVSALGVDPARLLASCRPSPGEARTLAMAIGLARRVWALVLDEPTNHLDLPAVERLETMLSEFPGALLLVTHDDVLASRVARMRWSLVGGRVVLAAEEEHGSDRQRP
jgi:ATPase subunit of ABC transporter with duplicated ATPase domains